MATITDDVLPHLDGVVSGLTPARRAELPFRCTSAGRGGHRGRLVESGSDRECEWMVVPGALRFDGAPFVARFRTDLLLRLRIDIEATEEDATLEAHDLAAGILADWIAADRRGVPATTGIQSIAPDPDAEITYDLVESSEGVPLAVIYGLPFILIHGSC